MHGPPQTSTSTEAQSDDDPLNISGGGREDQSAHSATVLPSTVYREKDGSESSSEDDEAVSFGLEATRTQHPTLAPSNTLTLEDTISFLNRAAEFFLRWVVPTGEDEAVEILQLTVNCISTAIQETSWGEVFKSMKDGERTPPGTCPLSPHTQATPRTQRIQSPPIQFGRIPSLSCGESEDPLAGCQWMSSQCPVESSETQWCPVQHSNSPVNVQWIPA